MEQNPGLLESCIDRGFVVIPLNGKIPLIKWKHLQDYKPTVAQMRRWFEDFPFANVGILTSAAGGIICLDCDKPPYPEGVYYSTPSGGRHYWYRFHEGDQHGIAVSPGHDVPWIVRAYEVPVLNDGRIPEQPAMSNRSQMSTPPSAWTPGPDEPPTMEHLVSCDFIRWFQEKRNDPNWDGRYNLARAYATNVRNAADPDLSLGPGYRHEDSIYARNHYPITCARIVEYGYPCPSFHKFSGVCLKAGGISTPFGLATKVKRNGHPQSEKAA